MDMSKVFAWVNSDLDGIGSTVLLGNLFKNFEYRHCFFGKFEEQYIPWAKEFAEDYDKDYASFDEFADNHKTFILLDGGGSNDMLQRRAELDSLNIPNAVFCEPDLNHSLSAIAFILTDDVYNVDLNDPGVEGDEDYARRYAIKSYISQFRLASN